MSTSRLHLLIFIVAYEANSTLEGVIDGIPEAVFEDHDTDILVIDDSSTDDTFEIGIRQAKRSKRFIRVLYNSKNQGYGGNQKLGYEYAIREGYDVVLLLHGDGQYAPACIPQLLEPFLRGDADAVFGSRMLEKGAARRGGMPLYKLVGNKILSSLQNWLLPNKLSEFHSGYRAYSVDALSRLPFRRNTNDFHFDTEIIIQLMLSHNRIVEVPIPTYYGDEICRVNGLKYAWDVVRATLAVRLHGLGILYQRRYDLTPESNHHYSLKRGYPSSHTMAFDRVSEESQVLDIGCGPGTFGRWLREEKRCTVHGRDMFQADDPGSFDAFRVWEEGEPLTFPAGVEFDYVLLLDIIEHMRSPENFLDALRACCAHQKRLPQIIVTTGNVAFLPVRLQLLRGAFNYGKKGILDKTHSRLYTKASLVRLLKDCGYEIEELKGIPAPFPAAIGLTRLSRTLLALNMAAGWFSKGLFSYQYLLIAKPTRTVSAVLDDSIRTSTEKAAAISHTAG